MAILMGIMALIMVLGIVSGHRHMTGGHEKAREKQDPTTLEDKNGYPCNDCPAALDVKDDKDGRPDKINSVDD